MTLPLPRLAAGSTALTELDRLPWAAGSSLSAFGVHFGVRTDDAAWLQRLREYVPPHWHATKSAGVDHLYSARRLGVVGTTDHGFFLVYAGPTLVARTRDETEALAAFESSVQYDVVVSARRWVFVHAGVVAFNGRAIVMPAPSMHGKSRLVEALVRAGATYYSDEFAVLDAGGRVQPFARPLRLRDESGSIRRVTAAEIGGHVGLEPLPIGLIVSTRFEADARWTPRVATAGEGVLALLENTVRVRLAPRETLRTLARAVEGATIQQGPRGEADEVAHALLSTDDWCARRAPGTRVATLAV